MSSEFSPELRKELLDDFYAECDELLTGIREGLSELEAAMGRGGAETEVIEGIYRRMHSIKGGAGIVGLRVAETLAHAVEDFLRQLTRQKRTLEDSGLELLFQSTQRMEAIITAHRLGQMLPDTEDLLARLHGLTAADKTAAPKEAASAASATSMGATPTSPAPSEAWKAVFAPSKALDQRGVSVKTIRERLAKLGEIKSGVPLVGSDRAIRFEFALNLQGAPDDLEGWANDGVTFVAPAAPAPTLAAMSATGDNAHAELQSLTPSHLVRVDLARLDELMRITGELVIQRFRLEDRLKGTEEDSALKEISLGLGRSLRELRAAITQVRMVPVSEIFARMPFVVRDLSRASGKSVRVELLGRETEIDKYLVERLKEPLLHLVRNAVSHGIESPEERTTAGKRSAATLVLEAERAGEAILIKIRDDGRGIDPTKIVARARSLGHTVPDNPSPDALLSILCLPGFSTRDEADLASGRGVGMAVVLNTVRELGGAMSLNTRTGHGTEFILRVPLTLSIADAIIVAVGQELCAVPQGFVKEIVQLPRQDTRMIKQVEVAAYRGGLLPMVRLRNTFRLPATEASLLTVLVLNSERGLAGLVVDRVRTQREIVIRPLVDPLVRSPGIVGATELGDGHPILVLDPLALTNSIARAVPKAALSAETLAVTS